MSSTVLYMSTSLDGFIAGRNETLENGLGATVDAASTSGRSPGIGPRWPRPSAPQLALERTRILEGHGGVTHMRYPVKH